MSAIASQITGVSIVCSSVCWGADQRKHQSPASLAFVRGAHRFPAQRVSNVEKVPIWWRHHINCVQSLRYLLCCQTPGGATVCCLETSHVVVMEPRADPSRVAVGMVWSGITRRHTCRILEWPRPADTFYLKTSSLLCVRLLWSIH